MSRIVKLKDRLSQKRTELFEAWDDFVVFMSPYLEKLKCVLDAVLSETDSLAFFQTYPKVLAHVDKILNLFVHIQCEFDILVCDEVLSGGTHDKKTSEAPQLANVLNEPEEGECCPYQHPEASLFQKVNGAHQAECDASAAPKIPAEDFSVLESVSVETRASVVSAGERGEMTTDASNIWSDGHSPSGETSRVLSESGSVLKASKDNVPTAKKRIPQCVLQPNEVLEMVYSHGDNPWNFWLCYYPCVDIELIQNNIRSLYHNDKLESLTALPDIGDNVLVADGERFLRGQVLSVRDTEIMENTSVMLLDVDSGRMKCFQLKYVWKISEDLVSVQAQAVNCQLHGILGQSSIWCKENLRKCKMRHKFEDLLLQTTLSVRFIKILEGSSLLRYVIDADCINLETDKIFNVTDYVNDILIPLIMCKSEEEVCSQDDIPSLLQNVPIAIKSDGGSIECSHHSEVHETDTNVASQIVQESVTDCRPSSVELQTSEAITDITPEKLHESVTNCSESIASRQTFELHKISTEIMSQKLDGSADSCPATTSRPQICNLHETNQQVSSQKLKHSGTDWADAMSVSGKYCSDIILGHEATHERNIGGSSESECKCGTHVSISTQNEKDNSAVLVESIYCNADVVLEKKDYSSLHHQTVIGFPKYVESPSMFYMQFLLNENDEFTDLHEEMNNFYSKNRMKLSTKERAQCYIKSFCAAMYPEDGQWYRVEVIDWLPTSETSLFVSFVDIGNTMIIDLDFIQPLAKQFAKFPVLVQKCHLYGIAPLECAMYSYVSYEWSPSCLSIFRSMFYLDRLYDIQLLEFTSYGSVGVLLVDSACPETSVNKKLITLGQAKYLPTEENLSFWDPMKAAYEEYSYVPYDDEDASVAVTGYSPKDEQKFCKFFARDGKCYKGNNCKKIHTLSHPRGWISDKREVFQEAFSQIVLPEGGETVYLQVTCVIRINLFYVILNFEENSDEETLLTLNRYINENVKSMRKLEVTPAVGQLVLARYHQDCIWYRARVIDTDSDSNSVQVFFVDYGNTEWVSEMYVRDIEPQYLHLPFQAIESSLAFAEMSASVDDDNLETVISAFRNLTNCAQPLKAKIISKDNILKKLELQLYDSSDQDIALMLADTGCVRITSIQMTPASAFALPG